MYCKKVGLPNFLNFTKLKEICTLLKLNLGKSTKALLRPRYTWGQKRVFLFLTKEENIQGQYPFSMTTSFNKSLPDSSLS